MRYLLTLALLLLPGSSLAECSPDSPLAKVGREEVTLSYFRYVERSIPEWALKKYYPGKEGKRELLNKVVERSLIKLYEEDKGLFKREEAKEKVERFKIKSLGYSYLNSKLEGLKVSKEELKKALEKYGGEPSPAREKSLKASLLAKKYVKRRQELLDSVKRELSFKSLNPSSEKDVVALFKGREIRFGELKPLISGKPNRKRLKKAALEYALYLLAVEEGLDRREEFKNRLKALKERIAVKEFERELLERVKVSDSQVKEYYKEHKEELKYPGRAKVRIYRFNSLKELKEAEEKLKGGKKLEGGRLWLLSSDDKNNPVAVEVFNSRGKLLTLETPSGYLLIEVISRTPPKVMAYGDAYSKVKELLLRREAEKLLSQELSNFKRRYPVELFKENFRCLEEGGNR